MAAKIVAHTGIVYVRTAALPPPSMLIPYNISTCHKVTLKKLINNRGFQSAFGTLIVLTFLKPRINNKTKAGIPIITLKLRGGTASMTILNKDQTEVQTRIKIIKSIIGTVFLEESNPIAWPRLRKTNKCIWYLTY